MSFSKKPYWVRPRARSSSSAGQTLNDSSRANEEYWTEVKRERSSPSLVDHGKLEVENSLEGTGRSGRQPMDTNRKTVEYVPQDMERGRVGPQRRDKQYSHASEIARTYQSRKDVEHHAHSSSTSDFHTPRSSPHEGVVESVPGPRRDMDDPPRPPPVYREFKSSDAGHALSEVPFSSQTTELSKRYETLSREHELLRNDLQTKSHRLEEKESQIRYLKADIAALQRRYEDQSSTLMSTRSDLRSCRSQLDNVQRFISTADAHADQDIIRMLQGLNEEVYQMSMTMTDFVVDGFTRQRKEQVSIAENVFTSIGKLLVNHLAAADEDIPLFLQLAFQSYLSCLVCRVVSSWTVDPRLNSLIDAVYQRLRKAETQSVSGRWRSLTRSHILPTYASEPKAVVEYALAGLSDIVKAAGLVSPPQCDTASKLASEFSDKISSIVSHAGRFGNIASEMLSGDFEAFAAHPGETFDGRFMIDMNEDQMESRGKGAAQTVLCGSRVGLKKYMGEKTIVFTKAQVVLRSFLG